MKIRPDKFAFVLERDGKELCKMTAPTRELCVSFANKNADCVEAECRQLGMQPLHGTSCAIIEISNV